MRKSKFVSQERENDGVRWWRVNYSGDALEPFQVIKETEHFVTYLNPRGYGQTKSGFVEDSEAKDSNHCPWFPSFEAGKSYLIGKKMGEIKHLEKRLANAKDALKELEAMQKPES